MSVALYTLWPASFSLTFTFSPENISIQYLPYLYLLFNSNTVMQCVAFFHTFLLWIHLNSSFLNSN